MLFLVPKLQLGTGLSAKLCFVQSQQRVKQSFMSKWRYQVQLGNEGGERELGRSRLDPRIQHPNGARNSGVVSGAKPWRMMFSVTTRGTRNWRR